MQFITTIEVLSEALEGDPALGKEGKKNTTACFCSFSCLSGSGLGCFPSLLKREDCTVVFKI